MGIKRKNVITMLCILVLNVVIIVTYYQIYLSGELGNIFKERNNELEEKVEEIIGGLEVTYDIEEIKSKLENVANYKVTLYNEANEVIYENNVSLEDDIIINAERIVKNKSNIYILRLENNIEIGRVEKNQIMLKLVKMEIVLIIIVLILLGIFTYVEYLTPIVSIQESMKNYKNGIRPKKSKRKDEFGYLQNTFVEVVDDLEKEKEKQSRIMASISHDIRTPLTSIMGYSERLKKGLTKEKQDKYLSVIYEKSKEIRDMVQEFDEYLSYNIEGNLKRCKIKTEELLKLIEQEYEEELKLYGIQLTVQNKSESEINIDLSKIRRVFGNLIGNSVKHLKNENKQIKIEALDIKQKIRFIVSDNGTGVEKEKLERIFEMLYTEDKGRKVAGLRIVYM